MAEEKNLWIDQGKWSDLDRRKEEKWKGPQRPLGQHLAHQKMCHGNHKRKGYSEKQQQQQQ